MSDRDRTPLDLLPIQSPFENTLVFSSSPKALRQCDGCKQNDPEKKCHRKTYFTTNFCQNLSIEDIPGTCLVKNYSRSDLRKPQKQNGATGYSLQRVMTVQ